MQAETMLKAESIAQEPLLLSFEKIAEKLGIDKRRLNNQYYLRPELKKLFTKIGIKRYAKWDDVKRYFESQISANEAESHD